MVKEQNKRQNPKGDLIMNNELTFDERTAAYGVEVLVNGDRLGIIQFDHEQEGFVYWPNDIDDGVSYFDSLTDTEQLIAEELGFDNFEVLR